MEIVLSLLMGVVPAFFYAVFVYWLDRYEKEPIFLLGGVFVWGAVVAAAGAFILNTVFGISVFLVTGSELATNIATGSISAPLVEESLKGLAVLIIFLLFRKEFDNILDGIVYAGVTALGFAATENSFYIYSYGFQEAGLEGGLVLAFIRNILVGWQHPFYTAFIGIGLAVARLNRNVLLKLMAAFVGWGLAVITHSFHNTFASFVGGLEGLLLGTVVDWTGWFFMLLVIVWAIFRERKFLREYLQEEVSLGVLSAAQYKIACSSLKMSLARAGALAAGKWGKTNRFYQLCAELAHKKRQRDLLGEKDGSTAIIEKLRRELAQLSPQVG